MNGLNWQMDLLGTHLAQNPKVKSKIPISMSAPDYGSQLETS